MTIIKNGCICGGDYYTNTEQCDDPDCRSERKKNINLGFTKQDILNLLAGLNLLIDAENDTVLYAGLIDKLNARL